MLERPIFCLRFANIHTMALAGEVVPQQYTEDGKSWGLWITIYDHLNLWTGVASAILSVLTAGTAGVQSASAAAANTKFDPFWTIFFACAAAAVTSVTTMFKFGTKSARSESAHLYLKKALGLYAGDKTLDLAWCPPLGNSPMSETPTRPCAEGPPVGGCPLRPHPSRSGRRRCVFSRAACLRNLRISSWLPFNNTSGAFQPRKSAGRVQWGQSSTPSA